MEQKEILFVVRRISDGHEYRVYDDGTIEGFGEGMIVFNYHPALVLTEIVAHDARKGTFSAPEHGIALEPDSRVPTGHQRVTDCLRDAPSRFADVTVDTKGQLHGSPESIKAFEDFCVARPQIIAG